MNFQDLISKGQESVQQAFEAAVSNPDTAVSSVEGIAKDGFEAVSQLAGRTVEEIQHAAASPSEFLQGAEETFKHGLEGVGKTVAGIFAGKTPNDSEA